MEELEKFYLKLIAELSSVQTKKIKRERLLPINFVTRKNGKETMRQRRLFKKIEKQRAKIEKGYYNGISVAIDIINKEFRRVLKCLSNSDQLAK